MVSRAILLATATATAFVAAGYVLLVVGVGQLLPSPLRGSFWLSVLATAIVAERPRLPRSRSCACWCTGWGQTCVSGPR